MPNPVLVGSWVTLETAEGVVIPKEALQPFLGSVARNSPKTGVAVITEEMGFRPGQEYGSERVRCLLDLLPNLDAEHIILTDLRDVIVQKDLRDFPCDRLGFHLEARDRTIAECEYNAPWIEHFYGKEMLLEIGGCAIANVSMVSGPKREVIQYVRNLDALMRQARPAPTNRWASGIDMAAHNVLIWTTDHCGIVDWGPTRHAPPIYTCGSMDAITLSHNQILDEEGNVPFMVHQYDRHVRIP